MSKKILVPIDFTAVSEAAVNHAVKIAEHIHADIHLLHLVAKKGHKVDGDNRMKAYAQMMAEKYAQADFSSDVRVGSIFDDISEVSEEVSADLIVMGTHGLRGFQFVVGSNALRIVSSSKVPFIVVQEKGIRENGYDDIVVPLDLHKQTKQKLNIVLKMAKYFNGRVHLISPFEKDEFLHNKLKRNLAYASQMMEESNIEHTVTIADKDKDFDDAIISHAVVNDADLICIMNLRENSLAGLMGGGYTQKIITNDAQIAALLINPVESGYIDVFGV